MYGKAVLSRLGDFVSSGPGRWLKLTSSLEILITVVLLAQVDAS